MRLGDLDALKKKIEGVVENEMHIDKKWALGLRYALKLIDNAPTVEPETKLVANVTFNKEQLEEIVEKANADILSQIERLQGEWIPCSEGLPDDLKPVNITWINHEPEPYYKEIKDKPFTATGVYFNGQWYWWSTLCTDILAEYSFSYDDIIDTAIEVIAWQPLPEPYKKGGAT